MAADETPDKWLISGQCAAPANREQDQLSTEAWNKQEFANNEPDLTPYVENHSSRSQSQN